MKIILVNEAETEQFGAMLWQSLPNKCLIFLKGNLGAGKTTLVRGFLRAAGYQGNVKSPTFTLVEEYSLKKGNVFHFDLYRIADPEELEWIGFRDYLSNDNSIAFIEWPELGADFLSSADLIINLNIEKHGRTLEIFLKNEALKNSFSLYWKNKDILL